MKALNVNQFSATFFLALMFAFVLGCEGPVGPAGADGVDGINGIDGIDGTTTCFECHGTGTIETVSQQFHQSIHSSGEVAVAYAGGRSRCARCHSNEGFVEFSLTGNVEENITAPTAWECATCHDIHQEFDATDWAFRGDVGDAKGFIFDETVVADFGAGNICINCHQSRRAEPNVSDPGTTFEITSTHYGPHHGAQSNVLYGAGFAEIAGTESYPTPGSATHFTGQSCTGCHMETYADGQGGHTWNPSINSCTECHAGATDFDINGVRTQVEADLETLRDLLIAQGVVEEAVETLFELDPETGDIVEVLESDGYHPVVGTYTMAQAQAFFNWVGLLEDRSFGVHNPAYTKALIANSIEAIQ